MLESIVMAILGGTLIGLAASIILAASGRIAGISGIVGGLLTKKPTDVAWRSSFIGGLFAGGFLLVLMTPASIQAPEGRSMVMIVAAGLLVGFGTRLGNGCTSGHGICGLSRLSFRSLVATMTFMGAGFATATAIGMFS
ncbi:MAG: YeeE/YedE thiosulfate transporter family protein [Myxococcota bacterium]|nr:YeeE/YedE thiosulfate transporter family protein [Myxococcota bacterium]